MNITFPTREEAKAKGFFFFPRLANAFGKRLYRNKWKYQDQFNFKCMFNQNYEPNMRERLPNEMVLEIDGMEVQKILKIMKRACEILRDNKICYQLWYGGNNSYYLQIYFDISLTKTMIEEWLKTIFIEKEMNYCSRWLDGNYGECSGCMYAKKDEAKE